MTAIGPEGDDRVELVLDINMDDVDLEQALSKTIKDAITKAFGEVAEEGIVAEKFGTAEGLSNRGGSWLQDSLLGDSIDDNKDFASRVTPSAPIIEPPQDPLQEANKLSSEYRARSFNDQRGGNEELLPEDGTGFADLSEFWENLDDVDVSSLTADQQEELKGLKALRARVDKESSSLATQAKSFVGDILPGRGGTTAIEKSIGGITENISTLSQLRGLGGGVGLASRAIPVAGAALAAYQGVQAGGEQIQELANIGNIQGEGVMGGLAFQANVQAMAMNPFINTEQARTIMMTALRDGYTGKEFDTLTDFMSSNLREMNLSASQSMELFQRQVEQGGQSIEALGMQLEVLKRSAPDANISLEQQQQIYGQVSGSVVGAGGSGQAGGEMGMLAAQMFNDNPTLKGRGGDYLTALNESPVFQGQLSQYRQQQSGGAYEDPQVAASNAMEEGVFLQQAQEIHKQWLQQLIRNFPAFGEEGVEGDNARNRVIQSFMSYLHQQGLARVFPDADHVGAYMDELLAGDIAGDAQKRVDESLGLEVGERRWYEKARSTLGNAWRNITGEDVLSDEELMNSADTLGDDYVQEEMQSRVQRRLQDSGYNLDALSAIIDNYDTRDVMIRDGDREVSLAEAEFDKELLDRLASGEATIKVGSGGEYQTLEDLSRSGEGQDKSDGSYIGGGKFTFDFTDEAKRLLKVTFEESDEVRDANSQSGKQPNTTDRHTRGKR